MKLNIRSLVLLVSVTLLLTFTVSGTVAFLADNSGAVVNEFTPVNVTPSVAETFDQTVKKNVQIKNGGNIDAYIRAMVIVTWQDADGNVLATLPVEGTDYQITWGDSWDRDATDGFYYHSTKVAPDAMTGILITECKPLKAAPEAGYTLHVEILAQAIQAEGKNSDDKYAVEAVWGVTVNADKTISK